MAAAQPIWAPLGELLVERGLLSQRQLELALQEQHRTGRRLGEVLVAFGFVSHDALTNTLLEQVGLAVPAPVVLETPPVVVAAEPSAAAPMIVRLDADRDDPSAAERKAAELEARLIDFERRSVEIQAAIAEMRQLVAELRFRARVAV
jgi:MSHA biogenesis protein MshE